MQRNWIGRSEGANVRLPAGGGRRASIEVFTTRPDTLFGATYMVLAPEHPLVERHHHAGAGEARSPPTCSRPRRKSDLERTDLAKEKTGVFTGALRHQPGQRAEDPGLDLGLRPDLLRHRAPSWPCPAHDERDFEFAKKFGLPIVQVVVPTDGDARRARRRPIAEDGRGGQLGRVRRPAHRRVQEEDHRVAGGAGASGGRPVNYKLRDWVFSPPALLGRADPPRALRRRAASVPVPDERAAAAAARGGAATSPPAPASRRWPRSTTG